MTRELDLRIGQVSDTGPSRERNEDYASHHVPEDKDQVRRKGALFLVADGMGGHQAGDVASREAVRRVCAAYYADASRSVGDSLVQAFQAANDALYDLAQSDLSRAGMGTTLVAAVVTEKPRRVTIANVGDSRAYLFRRKRLAQITCDHSWVEAQVQAGILTREQAQKHPQRNLITRALGIRPSVEVDLFELKLRAGDRILLCTDGVSGELTDEQMASIVGARPPAAAVTELVTLANEQGGSDNATALLIEAESEPRSVPRPSVAGAWSWVRKRRALGAILLTLLALCLLYIATASSATAYPGLAGRAMAPPQPAAIHYKDLTNEDLSGVAADLGYPSVGDMEDAHTGSLDLADPRGVALWPAEPALLVVGAAHNWRCQDRGCTFQLNMAGQGYEVHSGPATAWPGQWVRVLGYPQGTGGIIAARLIELAAPWQGQGPVWTTVFRDPDYDWNRPVWVYGTVDPQSYSPLEVATYHLDRGTPILAQGRWVGPESPPELAFELERLFTLEDQGYVPLPRETAP